MKIGTDGVLLGAWAPLGAAPRSILDVGAGCGLVSLILAQRTDGPDAPGILGIEIDPGAEADATDNFGLSPWSARLSARLGDFCSDTFAPALPHPMAIVSNPPFFDEPLRSPDGRRALARHGEGLTVETLIRRADTLLTHPDDTLTFIAPAGRDSEIEYLLFRSRFYPLERCTVLPSPGREPVRTLWNAVRHPARCRETILCVRGRDGRLSREYEHLTRPYYLDKTFR